MLHRHQKNPPAATSGAMVFIPEPHQIAAASLATATLWIRGHGPDLPQLPYIVHDGAFPETIRLDWYLHELPEGEQTVIASHVWRAVGPDAVWREWGIESDRRYWSATHRRIEFTVSVLPGVDVPFGAVAAYPAVTR